jgi:hypothetical protein
MNDKLKHLIQRQQALQLEASAQRKALSENMHDWHVRLKWFDRSLALVGFVRRHPSSLLGASAFLAMLLPNRSGKMFVGVLAALKTLRKVIHTFSKD